MLYIARRVDPPPPLLLTLPSQKAAMMAKEMTSTGAAVASRPMPTPAMMLVPWPVVEASAMERTGLNCAFECIEGGGEGRERGEACVRGHAGDDGGTVAGGRSLGDGAHGLKLQRRR